MMSPLRFFAAAPLHSPYMLVALAAVTLSGGVLLIVDPAKGAAALAPLALLQMFAASSGFAVAARRGHLDLLLTAGAGRVGVALAHLGLSVLPGVVAWGALGLVEMLVCRTLAPRVAASGSIVALTSISVLAWALTVGAPRLSGGLAWWLAIAVWHVGWSDGAALVVPAHDGGTLAYASRAFMVTLCPFLLIGKPLARDDLLAAMPVIALALLLTAGAVLWIARMDVPLESAQ